jgi:uroporphyrinogen decarboxylase
LDEVTGRHYMISALKRRYADRLPTTLLIGPYCARLAGHTVRDILTDPRKSADAHLAFYERFKPDSLIVYNDIYLEAEAIGCRLDFPEDNISHPKEVLLRDKAGLARLRVPDPGKDGRIPYFLEVCQRVSSQVKATASMGLGHSGPWNIAIHLRGAEALLMDTVDDPAFVHALMGFATEVVRAMGDALIQAGFAPSLGEAAASCSLISPTIYRQFIKPYHTELCNHFRSKRVPMALHICGYIDPIMQDILDTGISFLSVDAPSSLKKMKALGSDRVTLMGNVRTTLFSDGTREEMEAAIADCIESAAEGSGYILASGCEIPLSSTEDRVEHFFRYGHQCGAAFIAGLKERRPDLFQA